MLETRVAAETFGRLERPAATTAAPARALGHVLVLSTAASLAIAAFVLVGLDGWSYYTTPVELRASSQAHRLLRPAGYAGHLLGIAGFVLMLVPVAYSVRKKLARFRAVGSMKAWLEVHIFCGIVGPVCVTFHSSFKFNGLVAVAYWSMVAVALSGVVGRYLYVRIPRGLRGIELTKSELDARTDELARQLASANLPDPLLSRMADFEHRAVPAPGRAGWLDLLTGDLRMRRDFAAFRREIDGTGASPELLGSALQLIAERATLLRQAAYLAKTRTLFDLWHVFHMPLVYVMFAIVAVHVMVTVYLGYIPFVS